MQTIYDRIQQLKAEIIQLECLTRYDGIRKSTELVFANVDETFVTPTYTVTSGSNGRYIFVETEF